jgi:hypothetical protein
LGELPRRDGTRERLTPWKVLEGKLAVDQSAPLPCPEGSQRGPTTRTRAVGPPCVSRRTAGAPTWCGCSAGQGQTRTRPPRTPAAKSLSPLVGRESVRIVVCSSFESCVFVFAIGVHCFGYFEKQSLGSFLVPQTLSPTTDPCRRALRCFLRFPVVPPPEETLARGSRPGLRVRACGEETSRPNSATESHCEILAERPRRPRS